MEKFNSRLHIVYQAGFFGSLLRLLCDKFSKLSDELSGEPLDSIGRVNQIPEAAWSGVFMKHHHDFINKIKGKKDLPICLIAPTGEQGRLLAKTLSFHRTTQIPPNIDTIHQLPRRQLNPMLVKMHEDLCNFYNIRDEGTVIPKSLVRDWFKMEWLNDPSTNYDVLYYKNLMTDNGLNDHRVMTFPLESFLGFDQFMESFKQLDSKFELYIDFDRRQEIELIFNKSLSMDKERTALKRCLRICDSLDRGEQMHIGQLSVIYESFIAAHLEKTNKDFIFPLTDGFYETTDAILTLVRHYPDYYRMPNPHLGGSSK